MIVRRMREGIDIRVCLQEKVKVLVGLRPPCPLYHGQELVLVNPPSVDARGRLLVDIQGPIRAHLLLPYVVVKVGIVVVITGGQVGENVNDFVVADCFVEVGEDEQVVLGKASAHTVELGIDLGSILAMAHLQDRLDGFENVVREGRT